MRQQHYAFLFIGICAGDERYAILCRARVVGQMGHVGGDVEEIAGVYLDVVLKV